jgi:hypothetical protein
MSIGNTSLHQSGEIPEIVKLPNGRIRVTRRFHKFTREDIDNANLGSLMGDFGDLDTAGEQISNQGYTNCRLISVEVDTRFNSVSNTDSAVLVKTYETLTNSFVQITDDTITFIENGLKQITRVYRAVSGTPSSTVVGVTALGTGEILASSRIEDNDAFAELTETYVEAGILSRTEDFVGSQDSLVIEAIGPNPSTPEGFSLASKQESNYEGLQTNRFTFLKTSILSKSEDKVGSQLAITIEAFGEVPSAPSGYSLARTDVSNFEGIKTNRYTFLKPSILSQSEDKVGSQLAITIEAFGEVPATPAGYSLARTDVSDFEGIKTNRYTFLKDDVKLSQTEDKVGSQLSISEQWFSPNADKTLANYSLASKNTSDFEGIETVEYRFLKNNVVLSESKDKVGSQLAIVQEVFKGTPVTPIGYSIANEQVSDFEGIPTKRFTFLKDNVELSRSEDLVGSQLAITTEVFNPTSDPIETGYSVARTEVSDVGGIPTKRFTFLRDDVILSESEDKVGSQLAIVKEVFNGTPDTPSGYSIASEQESDVDGIPTKRYTFLKNDVMLSKSEDEVGSQNAITEQWFKPSASRDTKASYSLARKEESDVGGIPTERYTFLKDNVELSRSEDKVGSQLAITTEVFKPTADPTEEGYSVARTEVSDVEGIPTKRFTFLKDNVILSVTQDKVGSQESIINEVFNPVTYDFEGVDEDNVTLTEYVEASRQASDFEGIKTVRYTFLKKDVKLSASEDKVGSQNAIVEEWFKPEEGRETKTDYSLARKEESDVEGIPTERFTFLKDNVELSRSEDKVGSQLAITTEVFKPAADPEEEDYSVARIEVSDVDGIPTKRFTFLKDNVKLSESEDKVGSQLAKVQEWFNPTEEPEIELYVIANTQISDVGGIPTKRYTFLKDDTLLSETEDSVGSQLAIVQEWFNPTEEPEIDEYVIANVRVSDYGGIPTKQYTFLKEDVELSRSEDKVGSQLAIITEVFKPEDNPEEEGYSIARTEISDVDGIPTKRFTLLKDDAELSRSEDLVGSQLAIVTEVFNPEEDPAEDGYSLARTEVSDVDGIPTKRFTFLKEDVELSRSEDKVGSQLAITIEVFKPEEDPTEEGYSVARTEVSDVEGIPTKRFTFLKEDVELFHTEDFEGGLNEIVEEWFKPEAGRDEKADYVLIEKTESDLGGIPTERYTFWKEKGLINESYVNEAEGVIRTTQVFFSEVDDDLVKGPIVSKDTKNIDGIPTITVTTLQGSKGISIIEDGERLANSYDQLVSFTYPGVVSIQSNPVGPLFTSYAWRLSPPVECVVNATTYVIFQDSNSIAASDYTYADASGHWNPTEWAKGESYGLGYSYTPFSESKGFRGYRADALAVQVYENDPNNYLINGNRLYEDTTGGINIYGGPEDPSMKKYVLDVKITPAFVDIDGNTKYKKVIMVATIPQQGNTPVPVAQIP